MARVRFTVDLPAFIEIRYASMDAMSPMLVRPAVQIEDINFLYIQELGIDNSAREIIEVNNLRISGD